MGFRTARIKAGKSVVEAAQHMGVSKAAVYQWESGENMPRFDKAEKLAAFYGCTIEELLKEEGGETWIG